MLTQITLPSTVNAVGQQAFGDCTSLLEITLPEGVEVVEKGPQKNVRWRGDMLVKINCEHPKIALPFPIRAIGPYALAYSTTLEEINLPEGLEELPNAVFGQTLSLKEITESL